MWRAECVLKILRNIVKKMEEGKAMEQRQRYIYTDSQGRQSTRQQPKTDDAQETEETEAHRRERGYGGNETVPVRGLLYAKRADRNFK